MTGPRYDWRAVVARLLFSLLLVFSLYNPSGYSFWHWIHWPAGEGSWAMFWLKMFCGAAVLGIHYLVWTAVIAVLRPYGVLWLLLLSGCGFAALAEAGLLDREDPNTWLMAVMFSAAGILTAGLTKASIMHRLTGVQHVEEVPH